MRPHLSTSWKSLDAIPIAHLHEIQPTFADLTQVKVNLIAMLEKAIEANEEEFQKIIGDDAPVIPELMLYKGRAQGKLGGQDTYSDMIEVYVAQNNVQLTKFLFETSSNPAPTQLQLICSQPRDHPT
jgi:hypothetical protein